MELFSAAADRNKGPILEVLRTVLPVEGRVLEIASGSGQHVAHFATHLPRLRFAPSDPAADARASISAVAAGVGLPNLEPPLALDVCVEGWTSRVGGPVDAIVCINMIHIAPPEALGGLVRGAALLLPPGGPLVLYGPYRFHGAFLAESNAAFSESLRARNAVWGVRDVDDVESAGRAVGLSLEPPVAMPANNHVLVLRRAP